MENKNGKADLNEEELDKVSGGQWIFSRKSKCPGCGQRLTSEGFCDNDKCELSPLYVPGGSGVEYHEL